jgi:cytohesin
MKIGFLSISFLLIISVCSIQVYSLVVAARKYARGHKTAQISQIRFRTQNEKLFYGAKHNFIRLVREALDAQANVNAQNELGFTALHYALKFGFFAIADYLLEHHAKINVKNNYGETILHCAVMAHAMFRDVEIMVNKLLERGAKCNTKDDSGMAPLHYAAKRGIKKVVLSLLAYGADPDIINKQGLRAIDLACDREVFEILDERTRYD